MSQYSEESTITDIDIRTKFQKYLITYYKQLDIYIWNMVYLELCQKNSEMVPNYFDIIYAPMFSGTFHRFTHSWIRFI